MHSLTDHYYFLFVSLLINLQNIYKKALAEKLLKQEDNIHVK